MRRRSRLPCDSRGALLSGAWLVNCFESGVVDGAVSKMAPLDHMLICDPSEEAGPPLLPAIAYHTADRGQVPTRPWKAWLPLALTHLGATVPFLHISLGPELGPCPKHGLRLK